MLSELTGRVEGVTVEYVGEEWWEGGWMSVWDIFNLEFPFSLSSGIPVEEYKASKLSSIVDTTWLSREICNKKGNTEESLSHVAVNINNIKFRGSQLFYMHRKYIEPHHLNGHSLKLEFI